MSDNPAANTPTTGGPTEQEPEQPNVFGGKERELLINEIVREMKKDALKEDAADKMAKGDWRKSISNFFAHPAVLLLIGFAATGILGGLLAHYLQSQEWNRQQALQSQEWNRQQILQGQEWERQQLRLVNIHGIDLKYEIINEIIKAVGERNAAARGIVIPLLQEFNDLDMLKEEEEPIKNWKTVSHDWRANAQILKLKIAAHITSKEAPEIFKQILTKETKISSKVSYVQNRLRQYNRAVDRKMEERQYLDAVLNEIEETGEDLTKLVTVIAKEAQDDIRKKP